MEDNVRVVESQDLPIPPDPHILIRKMNADPWDAPWFCGAVSILFTLLSEWAYNEHGAGWAFTSNDSQAIFVFGTVSCASLQELLDVIDWTSRILECTVVFKKGMVRDRSPISYNKWYKDNGLVRVYYPSAYNTFEYAHLDSIPGSWRADSTGVWHPPTSPLFPHSAA